MNDVASFTREQLHTRENELKTNRRRLSLTPRSPTRITKRDAESHTRPWAMNEYLQFTHPSRILETYFHATGSEGQQSQDNLRLSCRRGPGLGGCELGNGPIRPSSAPRYLLRSDRPSAAALDKMCAQPTTEHEPCARAHFTTQGYDKHLRRLTQSQCLSGGGTPRLYSPRFDLRLHRACMHCTKCAERVL